MLRSQPALFKFCLCALFSTCAAGTACAASAADELADCLYANTSAQDKTTFLQWTYVALGRTEAAKSVQTIPAAKIKTVEKKAQTTLTQLVMKSCPKPAMNLLLSDPKKGLEKNADIARRKAGAGGSRKAYVTPAFNDDYGSPEALIQGSPNLNAKVSAKRRAP